MENKINIAELLRNCPSGMELDCTMWDNLYFDRVENDLIHCYYELDGYRNATMFLKNGCYTAHKLSKCVIFPKGKTTWKGFVPPVEFKDGDIVYIEAAFDWVCIYKENKDTENIYKYAAISVSSDSTNIVYDNVSLCRKKNILKMRIATKKEKQKLFHAIKANGYKWNPETKTLEKLPKFKVGNRIKPIGSVRSDHCYRCYIIKNIKIDRYILNDNNFLKFTDEHMFELVPNKFDITTLVPFESRVLVRNDINQLWIPAFWGFKRDNGYATTFGWSQYCIPYEGNEHLFNTANDCDKFYKTWEK